MRHTQTSDLDGDAQGAFGAASGSPTVESQFRADDVRVTCPLFQAKRTSKL